MKILRIVLAVILTLLVVITSRYFGPNRKYTVESSVGEAVLSHKAPRSQTGEGPAVLDVKVKLNGEKAASLRIDLVGKVKGTEQWERLEVARLESGEEGWDKVYTFEVPSKPYTTRYFYRFEAELTGPDGSDTVQTVLSQENETPMMVKFKGDVPAWIVICHVLGMFGGFFLLILAVMHAFSLARGREEAGAAGKLAWWSWITLFIGGVPFGFAMNYYAFNVFWEAFPFGGDVTDNKTQIALIIWGVAAFGLTGKKSRGAGFLALIAGLLVLAIFMIPHSAQIG